MRNGQPSYPQSRLPKGAPRRVALLASLFVKVGYSATQKMRFFKTDHLLKVVVVSLFFSFGNGGAANAAGLFELDFQRQQGFGTWDYADENHVGNASRPIRDNFSGPYDTSPMLNEWGSINGEKYIHQVIGDPASGFAQEIYIKMAGLRDQGAIEFAIADAGAKVGAGSNECGNTWFFTGEGQCSGNNADPLRVNDPDFTGNGTGNPTSVEMRMVLGGTWDNNSKTWSCNTDGCSEFFKDELNKKPTITQRQLSADLTSEFIIDMGGLDYSSMGSGVEIASAVDITNTLSLTAATAFGTEGDFSMSSPSGSGTVTIVAGSSSVDSTSPLVTGGRYTFTPGTGWNSGFTVYDRGVYSYDDGAFDQTGVDWMGYCDPTQNASNCVPWKDRTWKVD